MVGAGIVNTNYRCHNDYNKAWVPAGCLLRAHNLPDKDILQFYGVHYIGSTTMGVYPGIHYIYGDPCINSIEGEGVIQSCSWPAPFLLHSPGKLVWVPHHHGHSTLDKCIGIPRLPFPHTLALQPLLL